MTTTRHDPLARVALVGSFVLMLYLAFAPAATPATAEAPQQQIVIVIATPTLGIEQPALAVQAAAPAESAPAVNQPPAPAADMAVNEESRPAEHQLSSAPQSITIDPPQAVQPPDGAVLVQASDGPAFAAVLTGEGSKPARHRP